jgi:hypothetical protein
MNMKRKLVGATCLSLALALATPAMAGGGDREEVLAVQADRDAQAMVGGFKGGGVVGFRDAHANMGCAQRYKSYDPSSGTYLGYDGKRHACE